MAAATSSSAGTGTDRYRAKLKTWSLRAIEELHASATVNRPRAASDVHNGDQHRSCEARFQDLGAGFYDSRINAERAKRNHIRQLEALGYKVTLQPAA
jgi:hypothetical protein